MQDPMQQPPPGWPPEGHPLHLDTPPRDTAADVRAAGLAPYTSEAIERDRTEHALLAAERVLSAARLGLATHLRAEPPAVGSLSVQDAPAWAAWATERNALASEANDARRAHTAARIEWCRVRGLTIVP